LNVAHPTSAGAPTPSPANAEFTRFAGNRIASGSRRHIRPVEIAATQWSPDGIRLLLAHGLDVKSRDVSYALTAAVANGCDPIITLLLDAGADVNLLLPPRRRAQAGRGAGTGAERRSGVDGL
jgi:hypothetical protein